MKKQLVVNWHVLEECNFGCRYCFAHWPAAPDGAQEIWKSPELWTKTLSELRHLPDCIPGNWSGIRLNIAGGEPLLLCKSGVLDRIFSFAGGKMGFSLSIISNGYLMDRAFIQKWAPKLQILGVSMDSADARTNAKIGRCAKSNQGRQISPEKIAEIFRRARAANPGIECKLNTVVNAENCGENLHAAVKTIAPDRWKVFQMLPLADTREISGKQAPLKITEEQFHGFLSRHGEFARIMSPENNDEMTDSYVMIDPQGRFYQNEAAGENYRHAVSGPVWKTGAVKAFRQINFAADKFVKRYPVYNLAEA